MKRRSIIKNKIFFVVMLVSALALGSLEFSSWQKRRTVEKEIEQIKKEANQYEAKNKELSESLAFLHSTANKEKIARQQLNMKKEGEIAIRFTEIKPIDPDKIENLQEKQNNLNKWWDYFFNKDK